MAQGTIMPSPWFTGLDDDGNPLVGGKLYTVEAGGTYPANALETFSDVELQTENPNPVILDGGGRATVFLLGASYKFILKDANDVTIRTQDNISAISPLEVNPTIEGVAGEDLPAESGAYLSDGSDGKTAGRWYLWDGDNAYSSSTPELAMVATAISAGDTGTLQQAGRIAVSGPLTPGASYYVSNTAGALSSSAGTNVRKVGTADTPTSLVLSMNPATASGATSANNILANQSFS